MDKRPNIKKRIALELFRSIKKNRAKLHELKVSEKDTFFFVMLPVHYPFLFLNHLWSSQLSLFEKPSYRNK